MVIGRETCILALIVMRDLERTPVLSPDEVVISKKVERDIKRLASELRPRTTAIEARWRRRLTAIFGEE